MLLCCSVVQVMCVCCTKRSGLGSECSVVVLTFSSVRSASKGLRVQGSPLARSKLVRSLRNQNENETQKQRRCDRLWLSSAL